MTVKEFIEQFIEPNSLIQIWYKTPEGHKEVDPGKSLFMDWQLIKNKYSEREMSGITDILHVIYPEAINLVIK